MIQTCKSFSFIYHGKIKGPAKTKPAPILFSSLLATALPSLSLSLSLWERKKHAGIFSQVLAFFHSLLCREGGGEEEEKDEEKSAICMLQ